MLKLFPENIAWVKVKVPGRINKIFLSFRYKDSIVAASIGFSSLLRHKYLTGGKFINPVTFREWVPTGSVSHRIKTHHSIPYQQPVFWIYNMFYKNSALPYLVILLFSYRMHLFRILLLFSFSFKFFFLFILTAQNHIPAMFIIRRPNANKSNKTKTTKKKQCDK